MSRLNDCLPQNCVFDEVKSPVGDLTLIASDAGLRAILWEKDRVEGECEHVISSFRRSKTHGIIFETTRQLSEYFEGRRFKFEIPLILEGTEFQKRAWAQLVAVPFGETVSYAEQAEKLGDPKKARAVGTANARNPISIIVPCHRVIAKNGELAGFGGGLVIKKFLIEFERDMKFLSDRKSRRPGFARNSVPGRIGETR